MIRVGARVLTAILKERLRVYQGWAKATGQRENRGWKPGIQSGIRARDKALWILENCFLFNWGFLGGVGEGNGTPLQYSCLENPMDEGAWWAAVHGITKSQTGLSDVTFTFHSHALEKVMATHSSVLAWRIPGTEESDRLPSLGSHGVGHDWRDLAAAAGGVVVKNPPANAGDAGDVDFVPGSGRSLE